MCRSLRSSLFLAVGTATIDPQVNYAQSMPAQSSARVPDPLASRQASLSGDAGYLADVPPRRQTENRGNPAPSSSRRDPTENPGSNTGPHSRYRSKQSAQSSRAQFNIYAPNSKVNNYSGDHITTTYNQFNAGAGSYRPW